MKISANQTGSNKYVISMLGKGKVSVDREGYGSLKSYVCVYVNLEVWKPLLYQTDEPTEETNQQSQNHHLC